MQADRFQGHHRLVCRCQPHVEPKLFFARIQQPAQLVFLIADRLFGHQDLLDPGGHGGFGLQDVDDRHDAGLGLGPVAGQQFLGRFQCRFGDFEILVRKYHFPVGLFDGREDRQDAIAEDMLFDRSVVLCDPDKGFVHVDAGVAQQWLREGKRQPAGPGRIEEKSRGDVLIHARTGGTVVEVDISSGE